MSAPETSLKQMTDTAVQQKSTRLSGKQRAMAMCGGIGCVEAVKIIREFRRHGAEITAFFSPSVEMFITELSIEWATGRSVIQKTGASVEYLTSFDLVIVAPATLNTIEKASMGISDNAVTLLLASQFGRKKPICVVPTMNLDMVHHPLYKTHVERLQSWGAYFYPTEPEEDRLKMPSADQLVGFVLTRFSNET